MWGDYACFTRPEMKVERVTYPIPTPSAMRGVLEAIFWKPEFTWRIQEIWVLRPIRYFSILRNEVNSQMSNRSARNWERNGGGYVASEDRAQRHTLALRDVDYLVRAQIEVKPHVQENPAKYRDQFRRRVIRALFHRPYLGCREFAALRSGDGDGQPIPVDDDLDDAAGHRLRLRVTAILLAVSRPSGAWHSAWLAKRRGGIDDAAGKTRLQ